MKRRKGFTIIEVIISIVLIAIVAVAAFEFLRYCQRFTVGSELRLTAINFARERMEELYWNENLTDTSGWVSTGEALPTGAEFGSKLGEEYGGIKWRNIYTDASGNYKVVSVKVTWNY